MLKKISTQERVFLLEKQLIALKADHEKLKAEIDQQKKRRESANG